MAELNTTPSGVQHFHAVADFLLEINMTLFPGWTMDCLPLYRTPGCCWQL